MRISKSAAVLISSLMILGAAASSCGSEPVVESTEAPTVATFVEETTEAPETTTEAETTRSAIIERKEEESKAAEEKKEEEVKESEAVVNKAVTEKLASMSLEEKVLQLFIVTPETITGVPAVTVAGNTSRESINQYPVGGLVFSSKNAQNQEQVTSMLSGFQEFSEDRIGLNAFLCVAEEGGAVTQMASVASMGLPGTKTSGYILPEGGTEDDVYASAQTIGTYLKQLGFNVNLAPVADTLTNPENTNIGGRAFSSDPAEAAKCSKAYANGMLSTGILPVYKHFPGYGQATGSELEGIISSDKTLAEMKDTDLRTFKSAVKNGMPFIMVSHLSLPNVTGNDTPSSMSSVIVTDLLRKDMGYQGIIVTDSLSTLAVTSRYNAAEAAVKCIQAGCDMLYCPGDFKAAYQGILDAIDAGTLTEARIDESVARIISLKLNLQ